MVKVGIIGGSGLDDPALISDYQEKHVTTPYGKPSSALTVGKINGIEVVILARHGKKHEILPSKINFRANIFALKQEGCTHILASSAVGSLKEEIRPGDLVFPDQFIDFTKFRKNTFFDKYGDVRHTSMAEAFSYELRSVLIDEAKKLGYPFHQRATIVVVEGPRFSSRAESFMFRQFADIIGMTTFPEVALAKELDIPYASIAMSTDYDCWKEDEEAVTFEIVLRRMKENAEKVKKLVMNVIDQLRYEDYEAIDNSEKNIANSEFSHKTISNISTTPEIVYIKRKIRTIPHFPKQGIMFRDITTLLADPAGMKKIVDIFYSRYKDKKIDFVAGIESRGFIIGGILAEKLNVGFIPIRKKGKLPFTTIQQEYALEYGTDMIEVHSDAINHGERILLVDDLIATGGTASAAAQLIEKLGGVIEEIAFIIELPDLRGREKLAQWPVYSILEFEGE